METVIFGMVCISVTLAVGGMVALLIAVIKEGNKEHL